MGEPSGEEHKGAINPASSFQSSAGFPATRRNSSSSCFSSITMLFHFLPRPIHHTGKQACPASSCRLPCAGCPADSARSITPRRSSVSGAGRGRARRSWPRQSRRSRAGQGKARGQGRAGQSKGQGRARQSKGVGEGKAWQGGREGQ